MATNAVEGLDGYPTPGDIVIGSSSEFIIIDTPTATEKLGDLAARTAFEDLSIAMHDIKGAPVSPTAYTAVTAAKSLWYSKVETDKMTDPDTRGSD